MMQDFRLSPAGITAPPSRVTARQLRRLRLRGIGPLLAWPTVVAGLAAAAGVIGVMAPVVLLDVALLVALVTVVLARPHRALLVILIVVPTVPNSPFFRLAVFAAGGGALLLALPRLRARRVILPLGLLLLLAMPTLPIRPVGSERVLTTEKHLSLPFVHVGLMPWPSQELLEWITLGGALVVFCLAAWTVRDRRGVRRMVTAILWSSAVPIAVALDQLAMGKLFIRPGTTGLGAVRGTFTHPNYFAYYLVPVLALAIVRFGEDRRLFSRISCGALIALSGTCLIFTYTRAAWIGFAGVLAVLAILRYRRLVWVCPLLVALAIVAFPATAQRVAVRFGDRTTSSEASSDNSWTWRTGQWDRMLKYGYAKPFTGQGFGSYPRLTLREFGLEDPQYSTAVLGRGFNAHNDYVKFFVEMGLPGVLLWLAFLLGLLSTAWKAMREASVASYALVGFALVLAVLAVSISDTPEGYIIFLETVAALCGAVSGVVGHAQGALGARASQSRAGLRSPTARSATPLSEAQ